MAAPDLGTKTTVQFDSDVAFGNDTGTWKVISCNFTGMTRAMINTSHLKTGVADTFIGADRYDPGQLAIQAQFDMTLYDALSEDVLGTGSTAPTAGTTGDTVTINPGGVGAEDFTCTGIVEDIAINMEDETLMMMDLTVKLSGPVDSALV